MDALRRRSRAFRALVFSHPLIAVLLLLFYPVAALIGFKSGVSRAGLGIALLSVLPAAGFPAMATERAMQYSRSAAALGVPRHSSAIRAAQVLVLVLFVGLPYVACVCAGGSALSNAALLGGAGALGSLLARYPNRMALPFVSLVALHAVYPEMGAWLASPWLQGAICVASAAAFYRWLTLGSAIEREAPRLPQPFADARHEVRARTRSTGMTGPSPARTTELAEPAAEMTSAHGPSYRAVLYGLGVPTPTGWRACAIIVAVCALILAARHAAAGEGASHRAFLVICAIGAFALIRNVSSLAQAWTRRRTEEEILFLTPYWPRGRGLRWLAVRILLRVQLAPATVLACTTLIAALLAWIPWRDALVAALALGAASLAASAAFLIGMVRPVHKEIQWINIGILLWCAAGAAVSALGPTWTPRAVPIGLAMLLAPLSMALFAFLMRPLRFPAVCRTPRSALGLG